jgi:hypothetical protein
VHTVCDDEPIPGDYVWKPEDPLDPPPADEGIQIYVPKKDIPPGTEWETCYAVQLDWAQVAHNVGYPPGSLPVIRQQVYRTSRCIIFSSTRTGAPIRKAGS